MSTLNARANQAWREWLDSEAGDGMESVGAYAFEEAWEIGYKAKSAELPTQEQIVETLREFLPIFGVTRTETYNEIAAALAALTNGGSS